MQDGTALANFFASLERSVVTEGTLLTEQQVAAKLLSCREEQPGFLQLSFPTIAGAGPNGAIIHYNPMASAKVGSLDCNGVMLIDSGGQYESGTTDVTRTFHLGRCGRSRSSGGTADSRQQTADSRQQTASQSDQRKLSPTVRSAQALTHLPRQPDGVGAGMLHPST